MKTSIIVQNLKCGGCASTITNKLSEISNVSDIEIDVEANKVTFTFQDETDAIAVKDKLKRIGYPSVEEENSLTSKAKSFVSCATGKFSN